MNLPDSLQLKLDQRSDNGALRKLSLPKGIDFSSNDYLGFAANENIARRAGEILREHSATANGAAGSRLIAGHSELFERTEQMLAEFHEAEAAIIYNSGYDANAGFFSCIASRNDTIFYDQLSHASIRDGIRLSQARAFSFAHNDLNDLRSKLSSSQGNVFIAVESVYSMDGDQAPLAELVELCEQHGAWLIVDEAHSNGIYGNGRGLVAGTGLEPGVFARLVTFGKALGCHGAAWLGSRQLKDYLVNFSRSFIYTTAMPPHALATILAAYEELGRSSGLIGELHQKISFFKEQLRDTSGNPLIPSSSPIQGWVVPGNNEIVELASTLMKQGFDIRPIRYPTVPAGAERLRIILHVFNTEEEIRKLVKGLRG
ncbi:MAG: pyridoxal phosphate-dependent aminotransferase family protein [Bacteroidota bacterium]